MKTPTVVAAILLALAEPAWANMPQLTPAPEKPSIPACEAWAAAQDADAIDMWGTKPDGTSSRDIAILRLALHCLGDQTPDIVGFGSSAGFDRDYCLHHRNEKICHKHH